MAGEASTGPFTGHDTNNDDLFSETAGRNWDSGVNAPPAWEGDGANPYVQNGQLTDNRKGVDNQAWTNLSKPTAYEYGGKRGAAEAEQNRYAGLAAQADGRQGAQVDNSMYLADRNLDTQSRYGQQSALGNYQTSLNAYGDAMNGRGTSVAQQQLQYGLNQGMAQQASMAASARGGGANLASAQRAAAMGGAQLAGQTNQQAGILRAQEIAAARQGYLGAAQGMSGALGQMRGQDQSRGGQAAQNAQFQGNLNQQQHGLNDARNMGYEGMRRGVMQDQMGAQQAGEAANNGVYQQNANRSDAQDARGEARTDKYIAAGATALSYGAMASDIRLKHDVQPGHAAAEQAMDARQPYTYKYNDPKLGKDPPAGVMAQELEQSAAGAATVVNTPGGKAIDGKQALSLSLAENANLHHRLKAIEDGAAGYVKGGGVVGEGVRAGARAIEQNTSIQPGFLRPAAAPAPEFHYGPKRGK